MGLKVFSHLKQLFEVHAPAASGLCFHSCQERFQSQLFSFFLFLPPTFAGLAGAPSSLWRLGSGLSQKNRGKLATLDSKVQRQKLPRTNKYSF